jgi:hypothetical protein
MMNDDAAVAASLVDEHLAERLRRAGDPAGLRDAVSSQVARGMDALRESMGRQFDHLDVRSGSRLPDAYLLDEAAVENAVQDMASGYRTTLATLGHLVEPRPFERDLSQRLTPSTTWTVRCQASRVPRPDTRPRILDWTDAPAPWVDADAPEWPPGAAATLVDGMRLRPDELARVATGPYSGWIQIALIERQASLRKQYPSVPSRQLILAIGLEVAATESEPGTWPMFSGAGDVWSLMDEEIPDEDVRVAADRLQHLSMPLVGLIRRSADPDFGGHHSGPGVHPFVLVPSREVAALLRLRAAAPRLRLQLVDGDGPGLVCRQWSGYPMHDGGYGVQFPAIEGADLLLRPDLFTVVEDIAGHGLTAGLCVDVTPSSVTETPESGTSSATAH